MEERDIFLYNNSNQKYYYGYIPSSGVSVFSLFTGYYAPKREIVEIDIAIEGDCEVLFFDKIENNSLKNEEYINLFFKEILTPKKLIHIKKAYPSKMRISDVDKSFFDNFLEIKIKSEDRVYVKHILALTTKEKTQFYVVYSYEVDEDEDLGYRDFYEINFSNNFLLVSMGDDMSAAGCEFTSWVLFQKGGKERELILPLQVYGGCERRLKKLIKILDTLTLEESLTIIQKLEVLFSRSERYYCDFSYFSFKRKFFCIFLLFDHTSYSRRRLQTNSNVK